MTKERMVAIIEKIVIGKTDHYKGITARLTMNMDGSGCLLIFSMEQIAKMMEDAGIYDDVMKLVGKPCWILGGWGEMCEFERMWKK